MVYVDPLFYAVARNPGARALGETTGHRWCHMWCDEGDEAELHRIAAESGVQRGWFEQHPSVPHYDLTPARRELAIQAGAVEHDLKDWLRARTRRQQQSAS